MSEFVEVKTSDLVGAALNWAVAKAEGWQVEVTPIGYKSGPSTGHRRKATGYRLWMASDVQPNECSPSTDWSQGGPLIDKFILELKFYQHELPETSWRGNAENSWSEGPTPLIAACRAIVASVFGETVSVPKELLS